MPFGWSGALGRPIRAPLREQLARCIQKGKMMKSIWLTKIALAMVLGVFVFLGFGCAWDQLGETTAEGNRRHKRVLRVNRQEMLADIDRVLLLDKPSKLTDKRIP